MSAPGTNTALLEKRADGIAVITLDHFPLNALSMKVMNAVKTHCMDIDKDPSVKGVVIRGAGKAFCAGADVTDFGSGDAPIEMEGKTDMLGLEQLKVPVVAAIHGFALGGGLETCLGAHYRVMLADAFVGLPEVNLGLLPGGQ